MRLLVCGGRHIAVQKRVWRILDGIHANHTITCVIEGRSPLGGADLHAQRWAEADGVENLGCEWLGAQVQSATGGCWQRPNQPTALPSQVGGGRAIWLPWQGRSLEQTMFMRFGDTRVSHNRDNHTSSYYLYHEGSSAKGQFVGDQGI